MYKLVKIAFIFINFQVTAQQLPENFNLIDDSRIDESLLKKDFFTNIGKETLVPVKEEKNYVLEKSNSQRR
jgi:hypothetical protein